MLSAEENEILCRVGAGTPMGAYLRRFWISALKTSELPAPDCDPVELRLLGEDLVAFRDTAGQIGVLRALCPHRQAPLFYGRNEEHGLRCIYHGWKFNVAGTCVDMPSEPPESDFKDKVRPIGYPVQEWADIVWVYLGPQDKQPALPQLEWARVPSDQRYLVTYNQECNFVQAVEGDIDPSHIGFLYMDLETLRHPKTPEARWRAQDRAPLPPAPKFFEAFAEAFGATRMAGLALPEAELGSVTPELQEMLMQTVHLLAAVQERLVAVMPVTVRLQ